MLDHSFKSLDADTKNGSFLAGVKPHDQMLVVVVVAVVAVMVAAPHTTEVAVAVASALRQVENRVTGHVPAAATITLLGGTAVRSAR